MCVCMYIYMYIYICMYIYLYINRIFICNLRVMLLRRYVYTNVQDHVIK